MFTPQDTDIFIVFKKAAEIIERLYAAYLKDAIDPLLPMIEIILNIITVSFILGIIIILKKFTKLREKERKLYAPIKVSQKEETKHNTQWKVILSHINSDNKSEWKMAIIEADSILDDILKDMGYEGDTLGDRLKSAGGGEIIQKAWEAHKFRNEIAHGSSKDLTKQQVKRIISLYESIFKRFGYI